ncbi:SRPBCC family protein [Bacillus sp. MCCB 382]|uniref:SRPBCC family protein n=1 Tax=Bacillus sp. MCCB 382 TaxID=2860197 RepID=UPI001C58C6F2|nr:SRPBCC family protein [Bacillus sp. MCCB 382]
MIIQQTIIINAPIEEVYGAYADIHKWKKVLPDVLEINEIEDDGVYQEFLMTVSRPTGPETVHSKRICKKYESIELTQPIPPPGVKSMVGEWKFINKGSTTEVTATRTVELVNENMTDEELHLAEIRFTKNLKRFLNQNLTCFKNYLELYQEITLSIELNENKHSLFEIFWDIKKWNSYWNKIDNVTVIYDDQVHQEFAMTVWRDGAKENVRTIRYAEDEGIHFFSPEPPRLLNYHVGAWLLSGHDGTDKTTVEAKRGFTLKRGPDEELVEYKKRVTDYREKLEERINKILNSFAKAMN